MSDFMLAAGLGTGGSINVTPVYGAGSPSTWVPFRGAYFTPEGNLVISESGTPVVRNANGAGFAADGSLCTCTSGGTFAPSANLLLDSLGRVQVVEGTDSAPDSGGIPLDANGALYVTTKGGGPASLFTNGEQGAWYDPSDYTTLFEDAAGTIPITTPLEKPVGRMLDKSGRGNHATQTTGTSRPTLSARYNLLMKTEQFDATDWVKTNATVVANAVADPLGGNTADKIVENSAASVSHKVELTVSSGLSSGASYVISFYAKAAERSWAIVEGQGDLGGGYAWFNLANGTVGTVVSLSGGATITAAGNGWYRCSITDTATGPGSAGSKAAVYVATANGTASYTGDGTSGIYIWGADLRPANILGQPEYQRVNTATDYDTVGFKPYLKFDGTDDWLTTAAITPGTDKAQVFAGVRKLSDSLLATLIESSVDSPSTNGTVLIRAPQTGGSGNYALFARGTTLGSAVSGSTFNAPITNVISAIADIATDVATLRANGANVATNSSDMGTGNFSAQPLYIGRRGGTSLPLNGYVYSLVVRFGPNLTGSQIASTETWVNTKTGAY